MEAKPKSRRRYDGRTRQARASETKRRILDAANRLFTEQGIDNVTIAALAAAANVAVPTIYALFRSKAGVLKALVERSFFGRRYAAIAAQAAKARDPVEILRITASISRVILDTEREEIGLMRGSSAFSPDLKAIEAELERIRFDLQESRARLLVEKVPTARALGLAKVRDILWMFTGRDVYRMLVLERGWSSDDYESWLAATLVHVLITCPAPSLPLKGALALDPDKHEV